MRATAATSTISAMPTNSRAEPATAPVPRVTVLMPVYNGGPYLAAAIDSILNQTYRDFEFLIIDDGSTDASRDVVAGYPDPRIRLVQNGRNLGLIATLNRGLELARGELIARMDCDDLSLPQRLEKQVAFLDRHPEVGVLGTWLEKFHDVSLEILAPPAADAAIRFRLVFDNAFGHNTIVMRRAVIVDHGLRYDSEYPYAEDYDFWVRCAEVTQLANLPEILVRYRFHPDNTSSRFRPEQYATADRVRRRQLARLFPALTDAEAGLHNALARYQFHADPAGLVAARTWLEKLASASGRVFGLAEREACRDLAPIWYGAAGKSAGAGLRVFRLFRASPIGRAARWEWQWKLLLRCLLRRPIPSAGSEQAA